jgi:starch synthase
MEPYKGADNLSMFRGGAHYADAVSFGDGGVDKALGQELGKVRGKKLIPYKEGSDLTEYLQLYGDLSGK